MYTYISSIIYMYNRVHVIYMVTALLCRGDGSSSELGGQDTYTHMHYNVIGTCVYSSCAF